MRFYPNNPRNNALGYFATKALNTFPQIASDVVEKLVGISFNFTYANKEEEITIFESPSCIIKVQISHKKNTNIAFFGDKNGSVQIENNIIVGRKGDFESTMQFFWKKLSKKP